MLLGNIPIAILNSCYTSKRGRYSNVGRLTSASSPEKKMYTRSSKRANYCIYDEQSSEFLD